MSYKTYEEARKAILKSLEYTLQKESAVLVQGDKIVHFEAGKEQSVKINEDTIDAFAQKSQDGIICIHSHPNVKGSKDSLPLSIEDCIYLTSNDSLSTICSIS